MKTRNSFPVSTSDKISSVLPAERPQHKHTQKCIVHLFDDGYTPREISKILKMPATQVLDIVTGLQRMG